MKRLAILIVPLLVAACGKVAPLRPAEGHALPVKPAMATTTPSPNDLLRPPTYAHPARVDELMTKSQPREPDRFDLPPPTAEVPQAEPTPEDETRAVKPQ